MHLTVHLTETDIALYVEDKVSTEGRQRMEDHMADCPACVEQVSALVRLYEIDERETPLRIDGATYREAERLGVRNERFPLFSLMFASRPLRLALAGIAVVAVGLTYYFSTSTVEPVRFRSVERERPRFMMQPADGETLPAVQQLFRWSSIPHAMTYRFTLSELNGRTLWTSTVSDTFVTVPSSIAIQKGNQYLWRVEVVFRDNTRYSSPIYAFELQE